MEENMKNWKKLTIEEQTFCTNAGYNEDFVNNVTMEEIVNFLWMEYAIAGKCLGDTQEMKKRLLG